MKIITKVQALKKDNFLEIIKAKQTFIEKIDIEIKTIDNQPIDKLEEKYVYRYINNLEDKLISHPLFIIANYSYHVNFKKGIAIMTAFIPVPIKLNAEIVTYAESNIKNFLEEFFQSKIEAVRISLSTFNDTSKDLRVVYNNLIIPQAFYDLMNINLQHVMNGRRKV